MHDTPNPLVPLALLADAWHTTTATLADQLGPEAVITDQLGIRHTTVIDAAQLLAERKAREEAQRQEQAAHAAAMDALQAPVLARIKAIQAKQHAQRANGDIDAGTPAFVAMTMGDPNNRLEAAGRRFDDMLGAGRRGEMGSMYRFPPNSNQEAQQ